MNKLNNIYINIVCNLQKIPKENFIECSQCHKLYLKDSFISTKFKKADGYFCSLKCKESYISERYQKFKSNNICEIHKNERKSFNGKCWSCYKDDFYNNILKIKFTRIKRMFWLRFKWKFFIVPTFRTSENSWSGDKIAFEQSLVDMGIKWFVYIKFYNDPEGNIRPLVVGKSGSLLVNSSGSDLNFSTDIGHGPARRFLSKHKLKWNYDIIAIRKCRNEKDAYEKETIIMNKYGLYGS